MSHPIVTTQGLLNHFVRSLDFCLLFDVSSELQNRLKSMPSASFYSSFAVNFREQLKQ